MTVFSPVRPAIVRPTITIKPLPKKEETPDTPGCCVCGTTEGKLFHCEGMVILDNECDHYVCTEHRREFTGWCQIEYFLCPSCYEERTTPVIPIPDSSRFF